MKIERFDFISEAIESAKNYFTLLRNHKRGREEIKALSIRETDKNLFEIRLDKRIFSIDSIVLCFRSPRAPFALFMDAEERFVHPDFVRICKYDKNIPSLMLDVSKEYAELFRLAEAREILFISDLTFLVKNVQAWYEKYGDKIASPPTPNIIKRYGDHLSETSELDKKIPAMYTRGFESKEQLQAEKIALTNATSYIWGAPGTGKTQLVLVNSIMTYVEMKERVYIIAPTHNALEQVLRSVIKALEEQECDIDCLYHFGVASDSFVRQYGKICERFDRQEEIKRLGENISGLESELAEAERLEILRQVKIRAITAYEEYIKRAKEKETLQEELCKVQMRKTSLDEDLSRAKMRYTISMDRYADLMKKDQSILFRVRCAVSQQIREAHFSEKKIAFDTAESAKVDCDRLDAQVKEKEQTCSSLQSRLSGIRSDIDELLHTMKSCCLKVEKVYISPEDFESYFRAIEVSSQDDRITDISKKLEGYRDNLASIQEKQKTELGKKYVFAFTIDYLISHFKQIFDQTANLPVSHIFLDEAAYCPMIKAGVSFSFGVPVTFLGDHMQLPPICEVSDDALKAKQNNLFLWAQSSIHFPHVFKNDVTIDDLFTIYKNSCLPPKDVLQISSLKKTYRFGSALSKILNQFVYKNGFVGNGEVKTKITVIDAPRQLSGSTGRENVLEANAIKRYIEENNISDYAVLTPYNNQVQLLRKALSHTDKDCIMTIHRSQGREWNTVIFSVVDGIDNKFFTDSANEVSNGLRIINTAVSRARKEIVIVCDKERWETLKEEQLIGALVSLPSFIKKSRNAESVHVAESVIEVEPTTSDLIPIPKRKKSLTKIDDMLSDEQKTVAIGLGELFDSIGWHSWPSDVHFSEEQIKKLHKLNDKKIAVMHYDAKNQTASVCGSTGKVYVTSSHHCTCDDFRARKFPCKHMYCLAYYLKNQKTK